MKSTQSVSVIGGSDGPTAIFLAGDRNRKLTLRQKIERACYWARDIPFLWSYAGGYRRTLAAIQGSGKHAGVEMKLKNSV